MAPDTFADNIVDAGRRTGYDIAGVGPAQPEAGPKEVRGLLGFSAEKLPKLRTQLQRRLVENVVSYQPDVVIAVDRRLSEESVKRIKANGARVVLWYPDAVHNLGRHDIFMAGFDKIFFKNPLLVEQLTDVYGIRAAYLPEGANPNWHQPIGEYGTDIRITVAGNLYPTRALLLDRLLAEGVPLRIFGAPLPSWIDLPRIRAAHMNYSITREEKSQIFRSSVAVLNNLHPAEFAGSNCRLFEAAASGAVVLTEPRPGMDKLFEYDNEIVPFQSFEGLLDAYRRLVEEPDYARNIANRAARRVAKDHTWDHRLKQLLDSI
ncbi:CgeB family protein [Glutamicibacter sp. BSL13]